MIRRVWLFLRLVWREFEPPSCGIPDPYRIRYRFSVRLGAKRALQRRRITTGGQI